MNKLDNFFNSIETCFMCEYYFNKNKIYKIKSNNFNHICYICLNCLKKNILYNSKINNNKKTIII